MGTISADYELGKEIAQFIGFSSFGIYGWGRDPIIEFQIIENWLTPKRPSEDNYGTKIGEYTVDGALYTLYQKVIDDNNFIERDHYQYFGVRKERRYTGTIDITTHIKEWEKLGLPMGLLYEVQFLVEVNSEKNRAQGLVEVPVAKVYIKEAESTIETSTPTPTPMPTPMPTPTPNCSQKILDQGYDCCPSSCEIVYYDRYGNWGVYNGNWCGCR